MTPAQLSEAVLHTVRCAVRSGELEVTVPDGAQLRRPPHGEGHWATGIALRLAGPAGRPARDVAAVLRNRLLGTEGVSAVEISGPGFLTFRLDGTAGAAVVREIARGPEPASRPEDPARDAARWAAAGGPGDGGALLVQRESNPLFRVRYAHARGRALLRGGRALGIPAEAGESARYGHAAEEELLGLLAERERYAAGPAARAARYLVAVADAFTEVREVRPALPSGDEKPGAAHRARLALAQATTTVLAGGLHRLGISAPGHL
ncbi:DALR anticodon-binding domain-containing protein [Streptomyces sp. ACA25]|uniref:DALR anticodon-binding domain-containing protein n=1 Tax=Streptomyces sp. ACA25 TaxID=3022596 RepID=UPI0023073B8B|nr:DALR anticodon-binding domain-containing protein [Streptomyces sp. ACA25]MDB1087612.1 DALR anticodon-binding domain-containing protein [Streptomyces sp. ACA25]